MSEQSDRTPEPVTSPPTTGGAATPIGPGSKWGFLRRPHVRVGAIVALAIAAGLIAWLVVGRDDDEGSSVSQRTLAATGTQGPATGAKTGPLGLTERGLADMSAKLRESIYWVGAKPGYTYELTRTSNGNVYVRYLPPGVDVGDNRAKFLIVVTYPLGDAYAALKRAIQKSAGEMHRTPGGGLAWVGTSYPKSVHVAYQGVPYQIEIYDPSPAKALKAALSGDLHPVS
jgi:hypothetical protein